jgi:transcription-repair coupling factor (superfamily II helicase)
MPKKRIRTIEQFSALGSGIQIAMKDLEIRGAGDLLGGEQSGFINEIGFETYQKILQEAIDELKENEFKTLYQDEQSDSLKTYVKEVQIDTDLEVYLPDDYINIVKERLALYQKLSTLKTQDELNDFETQLIDRFGPLPDEAKELIESVRLKWIATQLGMERLLIKKKSCICYFLADQQSAFFQTAHFTYIISEVQQNQNRMMLKEKTTDQGLKLLLRIDKCLPYHNCKRTARKNSCYLQQLQILDYFKSSIYLIFVHQYSKFVGSRNHLVDIDSLPRQALENKVINPRYSHVF